MSALKEADSNKWINLFVAIVAILLGYISIAFFNQLGEWFDLEAKINNFNILTQFAGIAIGVVAFLYGIKNSTTSSYMNEVYSELTKVIWPDKDSTLKLTFTIVVGVVISAAFLWVADFGIKKLLELFY